MWLTHHLAAIFHFRLTVKPHLALVTFGIADHIIRGQRLLQSKEVVVAWWMANKYEEICPMDLESTCRACYMAETLSVRKANRVLARLWERMGYVVPCRKTPTVGVVEQLTSEELDGFAFDWILRFMCCNLFSHGYTSQQVAECIRALHHLDVRKAVRFGCVRLFHHALALAPLFCPELLGECRLPTQLCRVTCKNVHKRRRNAAFVL